MQMEFENTSILIVDDEVELAELLAFQFKVRGAKVMKAHNGKEALKIIEKERFDVILSDIRMPGGGGIELLANIKNNSQVMPPFAFLSGFSDLSPEEAYNLGAECIIAKPFNMKKMLKQVKFLLLPTEERWLERPIESSGEPLSLHRVLESFEAATKKGELSIGRGGLFIRCKELELPPVGGYIDFKVRFDAGDPGRFDGMGEVLWSRAAEKPEYPQGIGVEFRYLADECRSFVTALVREMKPLPFIPIR